MTDVANETEPLLAQATSPRKSKKLLVFVLAAIFLLTFDFGFFMAVAPQMAVFEDIICQKYKATLPGPDVVSGLSGLNPCKSEAVQGELALVVGYKEALKVIPGLVLSLPYGVLADRHGRKPFLYLSMLGLVLSEAWIRIVCLWSNVIPLRMVWLSALFRAIGGGEQVLTSIALVIIADVFSENERSTALYRFQSFVVIAEIIATPLSAYLMESGPMFPFILSFGVMVIGSLPTLFLPETLEDAKAKQNKQVSPNQYGADEPDGLYEPDQQDGAEPAQAGKKTALQEITRKAREFADSTRFIWSDANICLLILVQFVNVMSRLTTSILLQYVATKFNWSISRSSFIISLRAILGLIVYSVLMPLLSYLIDKYLGLHGQRSDHVVSKGTGILSIIGFVVVFLAPTPAVLMSGQVLLAIGSAFVITTRSLVTSLVLPEHVGTLYSAIAIAQGLGIIFSGSLLTNLFRLGMHLGNDWLGLPFLMAGVFFAFAVGAVWRVKPRPVCQNDEQEPLIP